MAMKTTTIKQACLAAIALAAVSGIGATPAAAQQFDCRDAKLKTEKAICGSDNLSNLDDRMSELYDDLMRAYSSKKKRVWLRHYQREFLEARNACRSDRDCIKGIYLDQISDLEDRLEKATRRSER